MNIFRKRQFSKLRDWINVITLLYGKTLKQSMVDKESDDKEGEGLKEDLKSLFD